MIYLYRDASNYKAWAEVVFRGSAELSSEDAAKEIAAACDAGVAFVARQVALPELFLRIDGKITEDDHSLHEFFSADATRDPVTDPAGRTIAELVSEFRRQSNLGWRPYDVAE